MNVKLAMQLLSQSTVDMIRYAISDHGIVLSLRNKSMYNHVADLCEHWNEVVDICNGRHGPHSPDNAVMRQTRLMDTLVWFSRKKCVWPWFQSQKAIFLSKKRKHKVTHLFNGNFRDFCETFSLGQSQ
jgi:hypothetical protein